MMKCTHTHSKLIGFIDGDLHPADRNEVEMHLRYCDACHEEYLALKEFTALTTEAVAYPDTAYPYEALRPRMAVITPLDEVMAFFPKLRSRSLIGRMATAFLFLIFALLLPWPVREAKETFDSARRVMNEEIAKWEDEYQHQLDAQYREQIMEHLNTSRS